MDRLLANLGVHVERFTVDTVPAGERMAFPALPRTVLVFRLDGDGAIRSSRGREPLPSGWLGLIPPQTPFSLQGGSENLTVACGELDVTYQTGTDVFAALPGPITLDVRGNEDVANAVSGLVAEYRHPRPGSQYMGRALAQQCLVAVFRAVCDHPDCSVPWLEALEDPTLAPALEAVLSRPADAHTVASLAAASHLSRATFTRRFTDAVGVPPMAYVREVRMREAARLLAAQDPVSTVARRVGYRSRSHFADAFEGHFGVSPTTYRADQDRRIG